MASDHQTPASLACDPSKEEWGYLNPWRVLLQ